VGANAGNTPTTAASQVVHVVTIEGMSFSPTTLTVRRGERVVWTNKDLVPHSATSEKAFDSGAIAPNAAWSLVTAEPGTYTYVCMYHPTMKASLRVLP
jgi:plastocyanin